MEITEKQKQQLLYASYANHCAIQKKVPMTWHSWKREQYQPTSQRETDKP